MAKGNKEALVNPNDNSALELVLATITKDFGKGAIMQYDGTSIPGTEYIPTGSISLDKALGGGIAKGRIIEFYGSESSGKTTLALTVAASAQKVDTRHVAYMDVEHALDMKYAARLKIDFDRFLVAQPDSGEEALQITERLARSGTVSLIVIDSVSSLVPKQEIEGEIGEPMMGGQARLMSHALRILSAVADNSNTTIIFINQIRMKIGVMFGNPETTSGGNSLKFYASQRLDMRGAAKVNEGSGDDAVVVARKTNVKVVKNKVAPPFQEAELTISFGKGIDLLADLLTEAVKFNIIEKSGAWYAYDGQKIGQGESNTIKFLEDNPDKKESIEKAVRAKITIV